MSWDEIRQSVGFVAAFLIYAVGLALYIERQFDAAAATYAMACFILLIHRPINK